MAKSKIKFEIQNGQLKTKKVVPSVTKTPYQRYRDYAIGKYGISAKNVLTQSDYNTAMAESRIATRKGGAWTPETLARAQKYDRTDAQIEAGWRAIKSRKPYITRKQYMEQEGWKELENLAKERYDALKAQGYTKGFAAWVVSHELWGSD